MPGRKDERPRAEAGRVRHDAQHRPVDDFGNAYGGEDEGGPPVEDSEPAIGDDRPHAPRKRGTLDPYHLDNPGEASPRDSPARPKAPATHEATEDGRLAGPGPRKPR